MQTVHKYPLPTADNTSILLPHGAKILHVDVQNNELCMWALVDPARRLGKRRFRIAGTGHPIEEEKVRHLGTALLYDGQIVLHVFEVLS